MPAHPHAKLMALYAKDTTETDKPWERWECYDPYNKKWIPIHNNLSWMPTVKYRRKPERPWYRVALLKDGIQENYIKISTSKCPLDFERHSEFVKWLTDRVYYDVE